MFSVGHTANSSALEKFMQFDQKYSNFEAGGRRGRTRHQSETETESEPLLSPIKIVSELEEKITGPRRRTSGIQSYFLHL